eukprot:1670918-Karenia_brevis.AAC.1
MNTICGSQRAGAICQGTRAMCSADVTVHIQGRLQRIDVVELPGVRQPIDKGADVSWRGWGQTFEQFWAWAYNASASRRPNGSEAVGTDELS